MKRLFLLWTMLAISALSFAQATDLVVDCQTPGWLSSKINYGDQQTVRNLKVTGYVNAVDMQFIGTLIQKQKLDGCVDLSNVYVTDENKDNYFGVNTFAMNQNDSIKCLILPRVLKGATNCLSRLHVDTLDCNWDLNYAKIDQFGIGNVDCIILGEKIDSIPANAFNKSSKVKNIKVRGMLRYIGDHAFQSIPFKSFIFPQSLSYIGNSAFDGHNMHKVILPDSIDYIGSYAFRGDSLEYVKLPTKAKEIGVGAFKGYAPDTIFVPEGIERFTSMFVTFKRGQTWIFPETVKYIDGNLLTLTGTDSWDVTSCSIYLKSNSVVEVSVLMMTSTTSIGDALENARQYRFGWTVYVPKGMIENYRNSQFWYRTSTGSSYGHNVYYAYCYWCHATFKEIENRVTGIRLDKDSVVLSNVGDNVSLTAFVIPENADNKKVQWISTNKNVCVVSSDGLVVATGQGVATIMCITQDGGYSATCTAKVIQHVSTVNIGKNTVPLKIGESALLKATVYPSDADNKSVVWSSSDEQIATVDVNGNVKAMKAGEAWIKAISEDNAEAKDSCKVTVIQPVTGIRLSQESCHLTNTGETVQLEATVLPADASNKEVKWSSSNMAVCVVSNGLVVATGFGTAVVIATTEDGNQMAFCSVTVKEETEEYSFTIKQIESGSVSTKVKKGSPFTVTFNVEEGWKIHSVSLNNVDCTDLISTDYTLTIEKVMSDCLLNVVYEQYIPTLMTSERTSDVKIFGTALGARVTGVAEGKVILVYSEEGVLLKSLIANGSQTDIPLTAGGIYIIKVEEKIVKLKH